MKTLVASTLVLLVYTTATAQSVLLPSGTGGIGNNTTTENVGTGTAISSSTLHLKSLGGSVCFSGKISSIYEGVAPVQERWTH